MLVIISDLHLTDGTSGETIREGAFRAFRERFRDLAYDASKRSDGSYRPIKNATLLLLGDVLDVIRSTKWLESAVRPWDVGDQKLVQMVDAITDGILAQNEKSLDCLSSLTRPNVITLPPATADGRPALVSRDPEAKERVPVSVKIYYMVGNHDWFFHLPDKRYDPIRAKIVEALSLSHGNGSFPHTLEEAPALHEVCKAHQIYARHGDIFDGFNYERNRDASSLGDAIVVELLNCFPQIVKKKLSNRLSEEFLEGLRELDNVRPLLSIPAWIDGLLRKSRVDSKVAQEVKDVWDGCADQFLQIPFVKNHDRWFQVDLVDKLQMVLKFARGASLRTINWLAQRWGDAHHSNESFMANAMQEQSFLDRSAKYVVYGHTHRHEILPLDSTDAGNKRFDQMYINSGTWRCVHERAQWHPADNEFMAYYVMTYLAFFTDAEREGRTFESWSGALGLGSS